jgi:hypothetical protein
MITSTLSTRRDEELTHVGRAGRFFDRRRKILIATQHSTEILDDLRSRIGLFAATLIQQMRQTISRQILQAKEMQNTKPKDGCI